jgi:hypothetical protein
VRDELYTAHRNKTSDASNIHRSEINIIYVGKLDAHESVNRDTSMKITNKMHYIDSFIIPSQLYMFWAMFSSIIRSTWLYLQYLVVFNQAAAGWCLGWVCSQAVCKCVWHIPLLCVQWKTLDDWQRNCPKHVEFHFKNKCEKLVHLVGFIVRIYHDAWSHELQNRRVVVFERDFVSNQQAVCKGIRFATSPSLSWQQQHWLSTKF